MDPYCHTASTLGRLSRLLLGTLAAAACLFAQAETDSLPLDLTGTGWDLVTVQSMDDSRFAPSANDTGDYSLRFVEKGRVALGAGCNKGQASLEPLAPPRLKFGPVAVTRALCRPPSVADRYLSQLPWVRSYVMRDGHLYLATAADASIIEYEPLADESVTARVLGLSLVSTEPDTLRQVALQALISRYSQDHALGASTAEIEQYLNHTQTRADDGQEGSLKRSERLERAAMLRHEAAQAIRNWKVNAALYATHGGRVVAGPQGPVPLDAQRTLLQEARDAGDFSLLYQSAKEAFWDYFEQPLQDPVAPAGSPEARSAFSNPPWAPNTEAP